MYMETDGPNLLVQWKINCNGCEEKREKEELRMKESEAEPRRERETFSWFG